MAMGRNSRERIGMLLLLCSMILSRCGKLEPRPGQVFDEARSAARGVSSFPAAGAMEAICFFEPRHGSVFPYGPVAERLSSLPAWLQAGRDAAVDVKRMPVDEG